MRKPSVIAIDGPVAAGKTAVGKLLAQRLGYRFVDTGSMYRAVTWLAIQERIDPEDQAALSLLASKARIEMLTDHGDTKVVVNGHDATYALRSQEVEGTVSIVSRIPGVREAMGGEQRRLAEEGKIVMAGRDIGTVILPQADLKVFLVASPKERARRRYSEMRERGVETDLDKVLRDLEERDHLDSQRSHSPLRPASDAHLIDTDGIGVEEVVDRVLALVDNG